MVRKPGKGIEERSVDSKDPYKGGFFTAVDRNQGNSGSRNGWIGTARWTGSTVVGSCRLGVPLNREPRQIGLRTRGEIGLFGSFA